MRLAYLVVVMVVALLLAAAALAQYGDPAQLKWTKQEDQVSRWIQRNHHQMVYLLSEKLSVEQIAALETVMFPEPTEEQKLEALKEATRVLVDKGGYSNEDAAVSAINTEVEAVSATVQDPMVPETK